MGECNVGVLSVGVTTTHAKTYLQSAYQVHCSVQLLTVFGGIPESMAMTVRV